MVTLYHGSTEQLTTIERGGRFGGIFCSADESVALAHGDVVHAVDIDDNDILSTWLLTCGADAGGVDFDEVQRAFDAVCGREELWAAVVEDDDRGLDGDESWDAQECRGALAMELGYSAIEMSDEHGTSYLVNALAIERGGKLVLA